MLYAIKCGRLRQELTWGYRLIGVRICWKVHAFGTKVPAGPFLNNRLIVDKRFQNQSYTHNSNPNNAYDLSIDFDNFDEFSKWVKTKCSHTHTNRLKAYFRKHLRGRTFESPLELYTYILDKKKGISNIVKTARVYLNYCEIFDKLPSEVVNKYRSMLKVKSSKKDFFVPADKDVVKTYKMVTNCSSLAMVYLILTTAGIRYVECLEFLKTFEKSKFKLHKNFVSYNVSDLRQTKNINNIYLPLFVYKKLRRVGDTYNALRVKYNGKKPPFSLKYLRKWQYNFLLFHSVPESVADFIQGRSSRSISANHYLARSQQAAFWYGKVASKLETMFK